MEVCLGAGHPCSINSDGVRTVCRQRFTGHRSSLRPTSTRIFPRLVALSATGEEYTDSFLFPSCCSCHRLASPLTLRARGHLGAHLAGPHLPEPLERGPG